YAPLLQDERITQPIIDRLQLPMTAAQLARHITVTVQPETVVLSAAVTDTSPDRAAAIANALAEEFVGLVQQLEQPFGPETAAPTTAPAPAGARAPATTAPAPAPSPAPKIGAQIIRPATAVPVPVAPSVPFNLALGAAIGLLVGLAGAFVRDARDTTIRSAAQLRAVTGAPVLAQIATDRGARLHPLTAGAAPASPSVEAFRKLRTNVQFLGPDRPHRVITVASATPGEGTSTTACNLALALADAANRVLLVDLNLRSPSVEQYLGLEPSTGATSVLSGRIPAKRAVRRWAEGRLDVLTAGGTPFNPSELLASRATDALLDEVRPHYDFIIIDTPALLPVTDAAVVAARSDGVILLVQYGSTAEEQVVAALNVLEAVKAPLLGVVLTRTPAPRLREIRRHRPYPEPDLVPRQHALPGPEQGPRLAAPPATPEPGPRLAAPSSPPEPEPATVAMADVNGRSGSPAPHGDNGSAASEHAADGAARPSPTPRGSG
ncbi:MAG TPA: polysaccharide biosynthesis tyrosine autokinase, partial [Pseudonocardia sp.]|nr:polysaccharide biosynthesis tyrosine autokinase [Pseudonocardia sp.]